MPRDCLSVHALGFFGEELNKRCAISDFARSFGERLALFSCEDDAQIVLMFHHQIEPLAQNGGAFFAGPLGPLFLRDLCGRDGIGHLRARQVSHFGDHIATRRVIDRECPVVPIDPGAVYVCTRL